MKLKSDAKFEEKLTYGLVNGMKKSANFHQKTWECQNWDFDGIFWSKVENSWAKNWQKSYVKNDEKFEEEVTCRFKIYMSNLTNFDLSTGRSQKVAL